MIRVNRVRAILLAGLLAVVIAPGAAIAEEESMTKEAGLGAAAAITTLIYGPLKIIYAACGLIFGGLAWGISGGDNDVMKAVVTPSVRGDYVVTPANIRMDEPIEFIGRDPAYRQAEDTGRVEADLADHFATR